MADTEFNYDDLPPLVPKGADRKKVIAEIAAKWCEEPTVKDEVAGGFIPAFTLERVALVDANIDDGDQAIDLRELIDAVHAARDERGLDEEQERKRFIALDHCRIDACHCAALEIIPRFQVFACRFGDQAVFGEGADFHGATFGEGAVFGWATFGEGADFGGATFGEGAGFRDATFGEGADFREATLNEAGLHRAKLDLADLTGAMGVRFDSNRIHRTIIPGNAPDPWSVLRRNYTGPWFFVHLLFLIIFFTPYIAKAVYLSTLSDTHSFFEERVDALADGLDDVPRLKAKLEEYREQFEADHRRERAVWVLVGWTDTWWSFGMALIVLAYNAIRALLTLKVSSLRDTEERSEITPALKEYMYLSKIHAVAVYIAWGAIAFALINTARWVWTTEVWLAKG